MLCIVLRRQFVLILSVRVLALHPSCVSQTAAVSEAFKLAAFDFFIPQLCKKSSLGNIYSIMLYNKYII